MLSGTITADTTVGGSPFIIGQKVTDSQTCTQSTLGSPISCTDNLFMTPVATPEPASLAVLGSALIGFGVFRRRRRTA
jgi:hypothetical protein